MRKVILIAIISIIWSSLNAQTKNKQYQGSVWFRFNQTLQLPKNFLLKNELEERFFITKAAKQQQVLFRFTFDKQLKKDWNVGAGFSMWYLGINDELNPSKLMIPEWRPHIEINHKNKISDRFTINQRFRAEWRFIKNTNKIFTETADGYSNNFRFRFQMALDYAVYKKDEKSLHLIVFDELFLNAGKNIVRNIFDQNRVGFSVRYNFNKKIGVELGYINWFQQRPSGVDFYNRQILRCTLHHNINIRKKEKKAIPSKI